MLMILGEIWLTEYYFSNCKIQYKNTMLNSIPLNINSKYHSASIAETLLKKY
jgi:hypothetical protein